MTDRPIDADVAPGVEIAEKGPDFERHVGEVVGVRNRPNPAAPDVAEEDTLIERQDLGEDSHTLIAKGDPIPPSLAKLPRRAARAAPRQAAVARELVGPVGMVPGAEPRGPHPGAAPRR
jgi:hypothetical protein